MLDRFPLILIRHGEVDPKWKSICYGQADVELSDNGRAQSLSVAQSLLAHTAPSKIFHSGLSRTIFFAQSIQDEARKVTNQDLPIECDPRLKERNYGDWQGKTWDDAYQSDPENFHDLIHQPDTYRPPNGETTTEMQLRVVDWFQQHITSVHQHTAMQRRNPIVAVLHSGPIAALCGHILGLHASNWADWMIGTAEAVGITEDEVPQKINWEELS